jgi:hypothetical protein
VTPATRLLRQFINMQIVDVRDNAAGVVLEVRNVGYTHRPRRLLLAGVTAASELREVTPPRDPDVDQAQQDIGDDIYERRRYEEEDT